MKLWSSGEQNSVPGNGKYMAIARSDVFCFSGSETGGCLFPSLHRARDSGLRGEFEGSALVVFAEAAGDAIEIAFAIEDDAIERL